MKQKIIHFAKTEFVLCIAAVCAVVSMFFVPPSAAYLDYIDVRTLCLLFCLMALVAGFGKCNVFRLLAQTLLSKQKNTRGLSVVLILLPFFSSMLITNDVALITFVPFTLLVLSMCGHMEAAPVLIVFQTIAANLGSMATPFGNPQNLFLYANYELSAGDFFGTVVPIAAVSFVCLLICGLTRKSDSVTVNFSEKAELAHPKLCILFAVLFVLTPDKVIFQLKLKLSFLSYSGDGREFRNMIIAQLKSVRDAVGDMSETVSRVTNALKEKSAPDTTAVYLRVRDNVCEKCASYNRCWRNVLPATLGEFDEVLETIRKTGSVTPSVTPMSLQSKCIRIMSLCDSFNKNYVLYSAHLGAEGRINEMRKITADQFDTVGEMLDDLLINFESGAKPLASKSLALKNSLDDIGVHAFVNCYEDENMNMVINMSVENDCKVSTGEIRECIIKSTEKQFPFPAVISSENEKMMLFWEQTPLTAECVYYQLSGNEEQVCGDCFDSFFDGKGNFIAVLSDGMGTGERAAVDGAMASSLFSRLIISGFSFPCALRLVNSAMLVKSYEESLATLDILKLNLYNGQAVIYKAGATASLLYRNGKVSEIKKSAMPIGILRQAEFATIKGGLKNGDVVIMMSDGAVDNSLEEIKKYVTDKGFSYDLPEKLCAVAKAKNKSHSDDITVAAIKIQLNESTD